MGAPVAIAEVAGTAVEALGGIGEVFSSLSDVFAGISEAGGQVKDAFGGLGSLVSNIIGDFTSLVEMLAKFTKLVNPALVEEFEHAVRDMGAVVGVVASEFIAGLTPAIREISAYLLPIARAMQPLAAQMAGIFRSEIEALGPVMSTLGKVLISIMPALIAVQEFAVGIFADLMRYADFAIQYVAGMLKALFGDLAPSMGGFKGVLANIKGGFEQLVRTLILVSAQILKSLGLDQMLQAMFKAAAPRKSEDKQSAEGLSVAQNPQFRAIDQLGKDLVLSAFAASSEPAAEPKAMKTEDFLEGIQGQIGQIMNGETNMFDNLLEKMRVKVKDALPDFVQTVINSLPGKKAFDQAGEAAGIIVGGGASPASIAQGAMKLLGF